MLAKSIISAVLLLLSTAATAQSAAPSGFTLTPYLWSAGFKGMIGASDGGGGQVNADFSNLGDSLEIGGFMLHADWRRDRWSLFGDWTTMKVTSSAPSPLGALYAGVDGEIRGNILQGAVGYRVLGDATSGIDAFGGLRYYDLKVQLDLHPGLLPARSLTGAENWLDAIVGARWHGRFNRNWVAKVYGDIGAGGSDATWQAAASIGYEFRWGSLLAGWRHLVADYDNNGVRIDAALSGPMLGASFRF